jgi:hypothetical protein
MRKVWASLAALAILSWSDAGLAGPLDDAPASAERIKVHMGFLASDLLEGRGTGARGHEIAAAYVASQLMQLGVKPAGDNDSYYQHVPMVGFRAVDQVKLTLQLNGAAPTPLVFGTDYVPRPNPQFEELRLSAPVVFAGFGIVAPEAKLDNYAGLDVKGKIVVVLAGAPASFQSEQRAYYISMQTKLATAAAHGAAGFIVMQTPAEQQRRPFTRNLAKWQEWDSTWREPNGTLVVPGGKTALLAYLSLDGAAKLFAGSRVPLEQIYRDAEKGRSKSFPLAATLGAEQRTELKTVQSLNVVGMIKGADPALQDEIVVLSSHLDGLGINEGGTGDVIFNGAMDNASGVSASLEVARALADGQPPRRTVVFLYDTAEEQSMAGSQMFAKFPSIPGSLVANVNLDMPMLTYNFVDVVAFGAERSSLGPAMRRAAERMGVALSPDPVPEEGLFTRSDNFSFVQQGVPSVYLMTGFGGDGAGAWQTFAMKHYHQLSDDLSQPIDYRVGAKFARLNYEIAREIADAEQRPTWAAGDFFGDLFGKPRAAAAASAARN